MVGSSLQNKKLGNQFWRADVLRAICSVTVAVVSISNIIIHKNHTLA